MKTSIDRATIYMKEKDYSVLEFSLVKGQIGWTAYLSGNLGTRVWCLITTSEPVPTEGVQESLYP